jgi:hypothetical protein
MVQRGRTGLAALRSFCSNLATPLRYRASEDLGSRVKARVAE